MRDSRKEWKVGNVVRMRAHHKETHVRGHNVLHVHYSDNVPPETAIRLMREALRTNGIKARITRATAEKYRVVVEDAKLGAKAAKALRNLEEVRWICDQPEAIVLNDVATSTIQSDLQGHYPLSVNPSGTLAGRGQIIMVADTGVDYDSCYFKDNNFNVSLYPKVNMNHRKIVSYRECVNEFSGGTEHQDGHGHGTHVCGSLAGYPIGGDEKYKGLAYEAQVFVTDLSCNNGGNLDIPIDLFSFYNASYEMGSRISHNSWGARRPSSYVSIDGETDEYIFEHSDYVVVAAAGNGGKAEGVLSPASAKNIISVGAHVNSYSESARQDIPTFSAVGPTFDGRIKPEIVAPGMNVVSALHGTPCGTISKFGTSMAAPFVSASAAIIRQYFLEGWYPHGRRGAGTAISPASTLVKALIIHSGRRLTGMQGSTPIGNAPNPYQGWGSLSLADILHFSTGESEKPQNHLAIHNNGTIGQNGVYNETFHVAPPSSQSLGKRARVTLVWHDPATTVGASKALVNDLDLVVQTTGGIVYGNNGKTLDDVNVVEQAEMEIPEEGMTFRVLVYGRHVVETYPYDELPFSVVVTGPEITSQEWTGGCPNDCNNKGSCVDGRCVCDPKFHHVDCSVCDDELHCSGNGECHDDKGTCTCHGNWEGDRCDTCKSGWYGSNCDMDCTCNGHGTCSDVESPVDKHCVCNGNWGGAACGYCTDGFRGDNCETPSHFCDNRNVVLVKNEQIGYIQINALDHYDNSVVCKWVIEAPEPTMQLKLTFIEFDIEETYDHVFVYDGPIVIGKYVEVWDGVAGLNQVVTTGSKASIVFESDLEGPKTGFAMQFETISPSGCSPSTCFGKGACKEKPDPYLCDCDENYDPAKFCSGCLPGWMGINCMLESTPVPTSGPITPGSECIQDGVECSGDGWCDSATKKCVCAHSVGPYCSVPCPGKGSVPESQCSGHGTCVLPGECVCEEEYGGVACQVETQNFGGAAGYMSEVLRGAWELIGIDDKVTHVEIGIELATGDKPVMLGVWDDEEIAGLTKYAKWTDTVQRTTSCYVLSMRQPSYIFGLYSEGSDVVPIPFYRPYPPSLERPPRH
eukprot:TRINITY_DN620_c1_g1_i1.p1 TRINITY_DN620_c1_g1~~TRINITY_DN620_c1_g1_i1.p1  ORF type:complete len:1189 (+),score=347.35 TRINITY_DN620_c1_g1_i1:318-3569(+)